MSIQQLFLSLMQFGSDPYKFVRIRFVDIGTKSLTFWSRSGVVRRYGVARWPDLAAAEHVRVRGGDDHVDGVARRPGVVRRSGVAGRFETRD